METLALQQPRDHLHGGGVGGGAVHQPENWLYEIKQKSPDHSTTNTCYVMVQNVRDLVKSHLMFAVREEVEVLKEKISELMDRINQLEYENNILKQNASQETLSQLTPSGTPSAAQSAQTTAGAAAASVAAALTPLAKSQAAAAASASSAAAAAGTPTVNPNANGSVS
ncbi:conserved hypothetical protein [Culex quinquefasciatus]|uniref:Uncharacterized protein n=1 Tax=Culex quinquefasciatus TaxID=7176 RepID=B0WGA5_CULQU|nr:conserved hypothetical protein [Culex quinquefasciatus]|eukprot:XP_001847739.1 conserved hypothetical protein [Culex quinquefasciatus]